MPNDDSETILNALGRDALEALERILSLCNDVEFAGGDADGAVRMIAQIALGALPG